MSTKSTFQAANGGKRDTSKHAGFQGDTATPYDSDTYDTDAIAIDTRHGNFSPDRLEDYRHENIVQASLTNGQFTQARQQCRTYGLTYETEKAKFDHEKAKFDQR